jgi:hypothetical protein
MASKQVTMDADTAAKMDTNGDGHISAEEAAMDLEFKRKRLEDNDAMRDAQRSMAWFALFGMLLYPFAVVTAVFAGLDQAATVLGSMAPTYFVSVAAIVAAFYGSQAYVTRRSENNYSENNYTE